MSEAKNRSRWRFILPRCWHDVHVVGVRICHDGNRHHWLDLIPGRVRTSQARCLSRPTERVSDAFAFWHSGNTQKTPLELRMSFSALLRKECWSPDLSRNRGICRSNGNSRRSNADSSSEPMGRPSSAFSWELNQNVQVREKCGAETLDRRTSERRHADGTGPFEKLSSICAPDDFNAFFARHSFY